jgi:outer membrane murein-binding lipoprotein Lpp
MFPRFLLFAFVALLFAGCQSETRVDVVGGDVRAAIDAAAARISDGDEALQFVTAAEVVALHAGRRFSSPLGRDAAIARSIDGKTPAEIIAAYENLGPELQLFYAQQLLSVRHLKRANDLLQSAIDSPEFRDNPAYAQAVRNVRQQQRDSMLGEAWLIDQLSKSPADLVAEFGPDK